MRYNSFPIAIIVSALFFLFSCTEKNFLSPESIENDSVESQEFLKGGKGRGQVTVMTWNIYVGTDVDRVLQAQNFPDLAARVAVAYQELLSTNFSERAETIVEQIASKRPHLIGLQEVSIIRRLLPTNPPTPVEEFDYLSILMDALTAQGLDYKIAGMIENANVTVPRLINPNPFEYDLVQLVDFDVILARHDVDISDQAAANYTAKLTVTVPGAPSIDIPRGYVAVDAKVGQKTYRFVNTHLEAFTEQIRFPQAQQLVGVLAGETLPIILVGDFNTRAPSSVHPNGGQTYQFLVGENAGYKDIWPHNLIGNEGEGFTSPHDSDLRNPVPNLTQRIDLIFVRNQGSPAGQNEIGPVQARVVGDELDERTSSGLWPSDHAGVIAKLHIQQPAQYAGRTMELSSEKAAH